MNAKKKLLSILMAMALVVSVFVIQAFAASASVNLTKSQTYALSGNFKANQVYIQSNTSNSPSSSQNMRAHCHYKDGLLASWNYDVRVFIAPGKELGKNIDSYEFANAVQWRLGLSPQTESNKGVSGSGTIVSK